MLFDLHENAGDLIGRCAKDMNIDGISGYEAGCKWIQQDVDSLEIWLVKWHLEFNLSNV